MPVGKYYCDYCEKQFQDTPFARKRHLQSLSHQKAKALWFDSFRVPNQAFSHGFPTAICNRFLRTGFCQYGDSCKYFHPNNNLHFSTLQPPIAGFPENNQASNIPMNQFIEDSSLMGGVVSDRMGTSWGNLPPSLMPPPEGGYTPLPFVNWG